MRRLKSKKVYKLKSSILFTGLLVLICFRIQSQVNAVLPVQKLFEQVRQYHPMSVRATMQNDFAGAALLKAKGGFDPTAQSSVSQKNFANKDYFSLINGEIRIPTATGIELKGGYEVNRGVFLGPENTTPDNGLWYGGVSIPLGQGLWIDDRRAELKNARIGLIGAGLQQKDILNELLYQSVFAYWEWFRSYHVSQILSEAEENANQRYQAVKSFVSNGDRPGIDTIEASIQIQNIGLSLSQAELDFVKATSVLSGFFWDEQMQNTGITQQLIPEELTLTTENAQSDINFLDDSFITADHPYLAGMRQKILQLNVEKKLRKDKLKPQLNIQYNPLSEAFGSGELTNFSINNYKWGLEFKMPLFLRKERGDLQLADLKIQETDLFLQEKTTELGIKFENFITEWEATIDQIKLLSNTVDLYKRMLDAERRLLNIGESSLFLVNAREQAYINARIKLTEVLVKNRLAYYSIWYYAGKLPDMAD
ncbi:MAG: TolC family protein [Saprospiraceae bacterium]|nr:TolC family protein [Saprospiraceae bacterium]